MSRPATASVSRAIAACLLILLLWLLAPAPAMVLPSSFGNFDSATGPSGFGNRNLAMRPSSFGSFHLAPMRAVPPALAAVATEFVWQFLVVQGDEKAAPYRDTS